MTPNDPTMSHSTLDAVIATYMLAVEAGNVPNRQELLDQHPEHAEALRAFFADLDRMDRVASPLRLADGLEETSVVGGGGYAALATIRYFGDYELLEEIARGGMGIVYKARQESLNRIVALKMILAGSFASSRDVQRFRSEAEAAANLDHPHIVPIYEIGEHEGHQYFSMKFVEGTSLAKHPRTDPRGEVEGMIAVIRAVHHAHQRGVLHRDLKPSNVLVDSKGTRLVADFGLAKRLADVDRSFTETGQVLGTPKYMAPEQAAGRKDLTVAADVYSLGVILYERLTGQTPFTGDNALTLLRQARESQPPQPSTIQAGLDRDLNTVVLKCLEKEPGRRYPSAGDFGDDLDRWLRSEPIQARPVSHGERCWQWCKRNPVVSGLTAAVAASLVFGIVGSTYFAVEASLRAIAESRERKRAENAENEAIVARDTIEGTLAQSLILPLNPRGETESILSEPETESLWRLAENGSDRLSLRFLEEATRSPSTARQLRARSEAGLVAALGVDPGKRERAAGILGDCLRNFENTREPPAVPGGNHDRDLESQAARNGRALHRANVALIAIALEDLGNEVTRGYANMVGRALEQNLSDDQRSELNDHLVGVSQFPHRYGGLSSTGVYSLREDARFPDYLPKFEPVVAAQMLSAAIENQSTSKSLSSMEDTLKLALALSSVAGSMRKEDAGEVCLRAAKLLERHWQGLSKVSRSLKEGWDVMRLPRALSCLGHWIDSADASTLCRPAAQWLAEALSRSKLPEGIDSDAKTQVLASGLTSVSIRLDPAEGFTLLEGALQKTPDPSLSWGLMVLSRRMPPQQAIHRLTSVMDQGSHQKGASKSFDWPQVRRHLIEGLVTAVGQLESNQSAAESRQVAELLSAFIKIEQEEDERRFLAESLACVALRMAPSEAATVCENVARTLIEALEKETGDTNGTALAQGLSRVLLRIPLLEAQANCRRAAELLLKGCEKDPSEVNRFRSLAAVCTRLPADEESRILSSALEKRPDPWTSIVLAKGLSSTASRLAPTESAKLCGQAGRMFVRSLAEESDWYERLHWSEALSNISSWLSSEDLERLCGETIKYFIRLRLEISQSHYQSTFDFQYDTSVCDCSIARLLPSLSTDKSAKMAFELSRLMCSEVGANNESYQLASGKPENLNLLLKMHDRKEEFDESKEDRSTDSQRGRIVPCRLTTQQLVELLKMPTCVGTARRVVLDHLGNRYDRRFVSHWSFVRFAQEQKLSLDFTTPPKRPDPMEPVRRMLGILDGTR